MKRSAVLLLLPGIVLLFLSLHTFGAKNKDRIYVGEKVCRQCHHLSGERNQFTPWRLSAHAKGWAALSMPESRRIAELSGVAVDPFKSPICLGCHTTASDVEDWERDAIFHLQDGVQCELCHGPGSEYMDPAIMQDPEAARNAGLRMPEKADCMVCHKEKGSHMAVLDVKKFDYEEALQRIGHAGTGGPLEMPEAESVEPLEGPKYVGPVACASCHGQNSEGHQYSKWRFSKHAQAYAILGTEQARNIARQEGVQGDPQQSEQCLSCHVTGYGEPAGRFTETYDMAQGVQCESCHGPGSEYMPEAIMRDPVASRQAGLITPDEDNCRGCHTEGIHGHAFDMDSMWPKIDHTRWEDRRYTSVEYKTPFNLAITRDGTRLYVACEASNSLMVVNPKTKHILKEIAINEQPHYVALSPDESEAYVTNRGSDNVSVIDTRTYQVLSTITVGDEPHEIAMNPEGTILYVTNAGSYDVSVVDLNAGKEIKRLAASRGTWGIDRSPDGTKLFVTNNLPRYGDFRETSHSEVTVIDTKTSTVEKRHTVVHANLLQGVAVSPADDFTLFTLIRTKNLVPMTRNIQGWIMTNGFGILWDDGRIDQLLLDRHDDFFADPTDIVFSKDGQYAFISGGGVQEVAVLDIEKMKALLQKTPEEERQEVLPHHLGISTEYVAERIEVGRSPRGMAVSPDNNYLYVADGLDDAISVIDITQLERVDVIDLGGPDTVTTARYGERIFHDAQYTFGRQFSCHSCHPDGGIDGITYDIEPDGLGFNPVDNRSLRGINDTAPFKWEGTNPSLKRQCGPRLAAFFTRVDPFEPEQAEALDRYIVTISMPPNRYREIGEDLTPAQRRGKRIFERIYDNSGNLIPKENRCNYCHRPPYYTDRETHNVGTSSWLDTHGTFDTPHLTNIYMSPPYLHDGRASSLEEIWTVYNPNDTHGLTNDLTKAELNDLIEYLKTL